MADDQDNGAGLEPLSRAAPVRQKRADVAPKPGTPFALPVGFSSQLSTLMALRAQNLQRTARRLGIFVLLPSFVVWFYTMFIATPRYVCSYEITYQTYAPNTSLTSGLTQSAGGAASGMIDYGTLLSEYAGSDALAEAVDAQLHVRAHYSDRKIDWLSRLSPHASQAQFLKYWQSHVSAAEGFGGYVTIVVQGFDPHYTLALANAVNAEANRMLDQLTAQAHTNEVASATQQLGIAATSLQKANDALTRFRNQHGDLDPSFMASQLGTIVGTLESQLATAKTQLAQDQANMQPDAVQIVQLKLQISALEQQITAERAKLANNAGSPDYSDTVTDYQNLLSEQMLANSTYQAAQQGLVIAEANAAQQQNYVVDFVPPTLPDQPTAPNPWNDAFITMLACMAVYGITSLLYSAFRDQTGA